MPLKTLALRYRLAGALQKRGGIKDKIQISLSPKPFLRRRFLNSSIRRVLCKVIRESPL